MKPDVFRRCNQYTQNTLSFDWLFNWLLQHLNTVIYDTFQCCQNYNQLLSLNPTHWTLFCYFVHIFVYSSFKNQVIISSLLTLNQSVSNKVWIEVSTHRRSLTLGVCSLGDIPFYKLTLTTSNEVTFSPACESLHMLMVYWDLKKLEVMWNQPTTNVIYVLQELPTYLTLTDLVTH